MLAVDRHGGIGRAQWRRGGVLSVSKDWETTSDNANKLEKSKIRSTTASNIQFFKNINGVCDLN